jgi:hypothetical protein
LVEKNSCENCGRLSVSNNINRSAYIAIFQEKSDSTQTEEQSTKKKSMKNDTQSPEKPKNLHGTGLSTYTQTL